MQAVIEIVASVIAELLIWGASRRRSHQPASRSPSPTSVPAVGAR